MIIVNIQKKIKNKDFLPDNWLKGNKILISDNTGFKIDMSGEHFCCKKCLINYIDKKIN